MCLSAERLQLLLESGILAERLYERGECILDGEVHFLLQSSEVAGGEAGVDPRTVVFKTEVGVSNQKVVGAVAVKGREPRRGGGQILAKGFNVGGFWRYDAPSENADPLG